MAILRQVRKKLLQLTPSQLEVFRRKLEHGQSYWRAENYVSLYGDRLDLRDRICAYLGLSNEPRAQRDWVAIIIGAVIGLVGLILSSITVLK
jgi:hypothetical protein